MTGETNSRARVWYATCMLAFAVVYSLISFVNHYLFRTYALDLGLYNQAIYDYSHLRFNYSTLLEPEFSHRNQLADHFDLMLMLISPFYFVFGTGTLLLFQLFAIVLAGLGIAKCVETLTTNKWLPLLAMIHFYSLWGIYAAIGFDYHSNVIAAMLFPWFFYFLQKNRRLPAFLVFFLMMICKENMALWCIFIASGFAFYYLRDQQKRLYCLALSAFAAVYFIAVMKFLMPALSTADQKYIHFHYSLLGSNYAEVINRIITSPGYIIKLLYESPYQLEHTKDIKEELHEFVLLSGGIALIFRPAFLWMLIPVYLQKLLNDDYTKWGINQHYSIEFAPVICLALFAWISRLNNPYRNHVGLVFVLLTMFTTFKGLHHRKSVWYREANENVFSRKHFSRDLDVANIHKYLGSLPADWSLSVNQTIAPHVTGRKLVYLFPCVYNADAIVLLDEPESPFPLDLPTFRMELSALKNDTNYCTRFHAGPFYIFTKKDISFSVAE